MIVFNTSNSDYNVVQLIMGSQTEFQFDLLGCLVLDITSIIEKFGNTLPTKLIITRCADEMDVVDTFQQYGGNIPISPILIERKVTNSGYQDKENDEDGGDETGYQTISEPASVRNFLNQPHNFTKNNKNSDPRGLYLEDVKCPACKSLGVYVKHNMVPYCADCLKIEMGLGNIKSESKQETDESAQIIQEDKPKKKTSKKRPKDE